MNAWTASDWLAAGALAVAALSVVLSYLAVRHARAESYRAALYAAQLDATREVLRAAGEFQQAALATTYPGADFLRVTQDELGPAVRTLDVAHRAGAAVLPAAISAALDVYARSVLEATFPTATPGLTAQDRPDRMRAAWEALGSVVLPELGVPRLSREVRNLTGVTADERFESMVADYRRADAALARDPAGKPPPPKTGAPD